LELNQEEELDSQVVLAGQMIEEDSLRYKELETKVERLYDDWIDKRINETNFNRLMEKTQKEQDILLERIKVNEEKIKNSESK
ncbi:recombinase RecB, partial [Enterococcus faecium]